MSIDFTTATEQQLRDAPKIFPKTLTELQDYIMQLTRRDHDYGSSALACMMIGELAMNYAANQLGLTGFQFSCAETAMLVRSRDMSLGGQIIDFKKALYPQYDILADVRRGLEQAAQDIQKEAKKLIDEANEEAGKENTIGPASSVFQHWQLIASGKTPYLK